MLTTVITAAVTSAGTTLAYLGVQGWWYRPRPVDPDMLARAFGGAVKALQGPQCTRPGCTKPAGPGWRECLEHGQCDCPPEGHVTPPSGS